MRFKTLFMIAWFIVKHILCAFPTLVLLLSLFQVSQAYDERAE